MAIVGAFDVHRAQLTYDYVSTETGEVRVGQIRPADRPRLRTWLARFEGEKEVVFAVEACTGWRYVVEELERAGCEVHLAEPADLSRDKGPKLRAKTDAADARNLREQLLQNRVPESWIPPTEVLEPRGLMRLYMDLTEERAGWGQRIRATLFHQGVARLENVLDAAGRALLPDLELSPAGRRAVEVGLRQIERLGAEIKVLGKEITALAQAQPRVSGAGPGALRSGPDPGVRDLGGDGRSQALHLVVRRGPLRGHRHHGPLLGRQAFPRPPVAARPAAPALGAVRGCPPRQPCLLA